MKGPAVVFVVVTLVSAALAGTEAPLFRGSSAFDEVYVYEKVAGGDMYISNTIESTEKSHIAHCRYKRGLHQTGWDTLWIETEASYPDARQMEAAGFCEGALSQTMIYNHYRNVYHQFFKTDPVPKNLTEFMEDNIKWTVDNVRSHKEDEFWAEVGFIMAQFEGLVKGYQHAAPHDEHLSHLDLWILNLDGDLEDIQPALVAQGKVDENNQMKETWKLLHTRCSALVRLPDDMHDLYAAHSTWDSYGSMLRIYKHYKFALKSSGKPRAVSFTASPAFLSSVDDWYVTNNGLVVTETTNGIYSDKLYDMIQPKGGVMSFIRCMIANYRAVDGPDWLKWFSRENSGTYNNQWIVVDMNKFQPGKKLAPDTVTIVEQIPKECHRTDVTEFVNKHGYWASYNIPYLKDIYDRSGFNEQFKKHGDSMSWEHCPRANIFRRDAPNVQSFEDMQRIMRYNNWKHDPLSLGKPSNGVVSRFDLMPEESKKKAFGGIDSKITSFSRVIKKMEVAAINGPTYDQQPVFKWSDYNFTTYHYAQPDEWHFAWQTFTP